MAEIKAKVFFSTQAERRPQEKVETVAQTQAEINTKDLFKTLAKIVAVVKFEKPADKLAIREHKALGDRLPNILAEMQMHALG